MHIKTECPQQSSPTCFPFNCCHLPKAGKLIVCSLIPSQTTQKDSVNILLEDLTLAMTYWRKKIQGEQLLERACCFVCKHSISTEEPTGWVIPQSTFLSTGVKKRRKGTLFIYWKFIQLHIASGDQYSAPITDATVSAALR